MTAYVWPMALVILCNIVYQICAKSVPNSMDPLASVTITYLVATIFSAILFFVLGKGGNLFAEYAKINWAPFVLGLVVVGLEVGFIYVYKAGWPVNAAFISQSAIIAIALLLVGLLLYKEAITWNKVLGALVCLIGLYLINQ